MKYDLILKPKTGLERSVATWLRTAARGYDGSISAVMKDLAYGGCESGMVGHLVYYSHGAEYFMRHRKDIAAVIASMVAGYGFKPSEKDGWDSSDPFAFEPANRTYLARRAFEETARILCEQAGWEG